ncbi:MAG: GAF domain-containing protein, partial [Phenylobacterium sp.]|nr:GAF domain-containing protein [Phenylobacterium sp.]
MSEFRSPEAVAHDSAARPFELILSQEVCDRATRLARTLFGPVDAQVVLVHEGRLWRSREPDRDGRSDPGVDAVLASGEALWVEDGRLDPRFADMEQVTGPPYLRFCAAAPISLADGTIAGVLGVVGLEVRAFDASLAGRLKDLAAFIADEWDRAQATKAREHGRRERAAIMSTFAAVVQAMPASLVIT